MLRRNTSKMIRQASKLQTSWKMLKCSFQAIRVTDWTRYTKFQESWYILLSNQSEKQFYAQNILFVKKKVEFD